MSRRHSNPSSAVPRSCIAEAEAFIGGDLLLLETTRSVALVLYDLVYYVLLIIVSYRKLFKMMNPKTSLASPLLYFERLATKLYAIQDWNL